MTQNFEVSLSGNFFFHIIQTVQVRINIFFALYADNVWMGVGLVTIVSITSIREPQFKHLTQ